MSLGKYTLNDQGEPVLEPDLMTWANWYETSSKQRRILYDIIGGKFVSTIFLGLDFGAPGSNFPVLWETVVGRLSDRNKLVKMEVWIDHRRHISRWDAENYHKGKVKLLQLLKEREVKEINQS